MNNICRENREHHITQPWFRAHDTLPFVDSSHTGSQLSRNCHLEQSGGPAVELSVADPETNALITEVLSGCRYVSAESVAKAR